MAGLPPEEDGLALDRETMRQLGYRTVDLLVDWLAREGPPLRRASPAEMRARLGGPPPDAPEPFDHILDGLERDVLPFASRDGHPRFFGFIPFSGTWPGALGDLIASACNFYAGSWMESAGPSQVELEVLGWFKDWLGYPAEAAGSLVSGGSAANMTALACARETLAGPMRDDLVVYVSDQGHSSLARAARMHGFRPAQVRVLPTDSGFRLAPRTLSAAIGADLAAGRTPFLVAANAGATNSGAVDPLPELGELCAEHGAWLHVDAAYGGFAVLTERGREALRGIELADSIAVDPHKWLYQPFECGCVLVREGSSLRRAFELTPDYLRDAVADKDEVNFGDLGIQLSRSARALKLWVSLRYFGVDAFRTAIDRTLDLAELAARRVDEVEDFELLAPPSLGVVCFRRRFGAEDETELEQLNAGLIAALERSGLGLVSSTRLHGLYALRLCVLNHTSRPGDVEAVLNFLEHAEPEPAASRYERNPAVVPSWPSFPQGELESLRRLPLFAELELAEAEHVAGLAAIREADPGEAVVEQWSLGRDFYVILEGEASVAIDGEHARDLGPGEFFGELTALDWGAGFAYPRLASVHATSALRLLVFPEGSLNELVRRYPPVDRRIREAVAHRLPRHT